MRIWLALCALVAAWPVFASAPESSLRPLVRGASEGAQITPVTTLRPKARAALVQAAKSAPPDAAEITRVVQLRPKARRAGQFDQQAVQRRIAARVGAARAPTSDDLAANTPGVLVVATTVRSLRPAARPRSITQKVMARQAAKNKGNTGGIRGIQGQAVGNVPGKGPCGIKNALKVTHVSGVKLTQPALMDRNTAKALKRWVDRGMTPAIGKMGGGVQSIRVVAHYACRTRNSQPGAKMSEHAFGRAIDIAGFTLRNGDKISLLDHWGRGAKGRALRKMHRSACGPFGTVLGPEANRFHRDHFHFDTARYRSGSYCR